MLLLRSVTRFVSRVDLVYKHDQRWPPGTDAISIVDVCYARWVNSSLEAYRLILPTVPKLFCDALYFGGDRDGSCHSSGGQSRGLKDSGKTPTHRC
jgi:hypothetical protein